ncbi:MAG: hypothetical protein A2528_00795 [Candidatus Staskawiczbacteria bacterium RIFOXYD2_FULL_37_9]|uniref:Uncharacterized protein n=1 Tax=Candidatus Staskawiczbacteria bacterium RIFOXYB1_FULL_37_44 TaxID=1802223 RepID=A0A1G2IWM0_9BACT|nr:MAG: hypothetical protein A2358_03215 [Candidatus Staskawiczbacteria bacterium RIFOXYB1_FULL_37_44]OGZ84443.1 MAG: hypothetical protein A2416_00085 [Candidatus Staskawiczbacteria bacterium RIFOXYC1_FULL_37_52]OGZ88522.1 MAG: hypothetical protein A2444_03540 [Candidatus Staskawiczbacteria bacterium RIFOXYC2_FULL_37_19]OGZ89880.1 MAG: hypothetical protein A2581_00870 [Candidatus Staskawiczbacteria bacterium RIFOXYD1_FULL_37_110]OGZ94763.1 MAG: hypothetical protein A2528_00795 [Candidatus Stask
MNTNEEIVCGFDSLRDFVGRALKAVRMARLTRLELSKALRLDFGLSQATEQWILIVEDAKFHLLFEEFEILCKALSFSPEEVLLYARELKEKNAG